VIPAIRRQLAAVDVDLEVRAFTQAEDQILRDTARQRLYMRLLMSFALLGLILAATGTYAVISYSVAQRTHEIGIRMALGARRCNVAAFVIKEGLVLTLIGTMIGVAGALALTRVLRSLLYGVASTDPTTYAAVSVLFLVVGLIACYVPARKASRIDPMAALRCE
jgi:putative ABC transport system permease protein